MASIVKDEWVDDPVQSESDWVDEPSSNTQVPANVPNQRGTMNPYVQTALNAVSNSPIGMASRGMGSIQRGLGLLTTPFIPASDKAQQFLSPIFRGSRALGVGTAQQSVSPQTPGAILNSAREARRAFQPGYEPRNTITRVGATVGENAPVIAATALSPVVGGPVSMAAQQVAETGKFSPVVAGSAALPLFSRAAEGMSVPLARRSLGFQKQFLKTPFARGKATQAAQTALEENIIPYSGNPQTMLDRATGIASTEGQKIGQTLKRTPSDIGTAYDNLENLRNELTQGTQGGVYQSTNKAIDTIQESLSQLASRGDPSAKMNDLAMSLFEKKQVRPSGSTKINASELNKIKEKVGKSLNYLADQASQLDNKAIVNNLANTIRDSVKQFVSPKEYVSFLKSQKLYSAAELMQKGLNNEISSQMSNMPLSLPSIGSGIGSAVLTGNPLKAAASTGIFEALKRRGAGSSARLLSDIGKQSKNIPAPAIGTMLAKKVLDEQSAIKYLENFNWDVNAARAAAKKDGWVIP